MRSVLAFLVRLYPAAWRRRYEAEFRGLITDGDLRPSDLPDVFFWALRARLTSSGPRPERMRTAMSQLLQSTTTHPTRLATVGLVIVLPTLLLVTLSILKYVVGFAGPFDAVEPFASPWVTSPIVETALILAPYVALLLATMPVVQLRIGWHQSRLNGSIAVSAPAVNLVVAFLSLAVAGVMALYWVAENL
jgi:hypothetical protein